MLAFRAARPPRPLAHARGDILCAAESVSATLLAEALPTYAAGRAGFTLSNATGFSPE